MDNIKYLIRLVVLLLLLVFVALFVSDNANAIISFLLGVLLFLFVAYLAWPVRRR